MLNLADNRSESVRRWVETNSPTPKNYNETPKSKNSINNNNTIEFFPKQFWSNRDDMPMLLQQPSHGLLSPHEADQPLDFTMSKFKTKTNNSVTSHIKQQFNNFANQQHLLFQNNTLYFNRSNNNRSLTRGSSPSSSSEEEGVGPPISSPRSSLPSPGPLHDGK